MWKSSPLGSRPLHSRTIALYRMTLERLHSEVLVSFDLQRLFPCGWSNAFDADAIDAIVVAEFLETLVEREKG